MHGGNTPKGIAHPNYSTGLHSKYVPAHMQAGYDQAITDPNLLSLKHDIALLDTRRDEILQQLSTGQTWSKVTELAYQVQNDLDALPMLLDAIAEGSKEQSVWAEWSSLAEQRRKHVDSERARLKDLNAMVSVEQVMILAASFAALVKKYVSDPVALRGISEGLIKLLNRPDVTGKVTPD